MENPNLGKSSTGLDANVAGLLCYLLGWITGLVFFLIEKESKFVRFHALQSIIVFGSFTVLPFVLIMIPAIGPLLLPLVSLVELVVWILLMVKTFQGETFKIPYVGDIAEKNA